MMRRQETSTERISSRWILVVQVQILQKAPKLSSKLILMRRASCIHPPSHHLPTSTHWGPKFGGSFSLVSVDPLDEEVLCLCYSKNILQTDRGWGGVRCVWVCECVFSPSPPVLVVKVWPHRPYGKCFNLSLSRTWMFSRARKNKSFQRPSRGKMSISGGFHKLEISV